MRKKTTLSFFFLLISALMISGCSNQKIDISGDINPEKPLDSQLSDNSRLSDAFEIKGQIQQSTPSQNQENQDLDQQKESQSDNPSQPDSQNFQIDQDLIEKHKTATLITNMGKIEVELFAQDCPKTVNNFLKLAKENFYDGTKFHRVIKDFMIQGGDPNSKDDDLSDDGQGGPGYKFEDEINDKKLVCGSLAMANSGPNTNGSQFFIVTKEATPWLDGKHTVFGKVTAGMDIVDKIENIKTDQNDHPTENVTIEDIQLLP